MEYALNSWFHYHYSRKTSPVYGGNIRLGLDKFKGYWVGKVAIEQDSATFMVHEK